MYVYMQMYYTRGCTHLDDVPRPSGGVDMDVSVARSQGSAGPTTAFSRSRLPCSCASGDCRGAELPRGGLSRSFMYLVEYPKSPYTAHLRTLILKTIPGIAFEARVLEWAVCGDIIPNHPLIGLM